MGAENIPMLLAAHRILREFAAEGLFCIEEYCDGEVTTKYITPDEIDEMLFGKYNMIPKKVIKEDIKEYGQE